MRGTTAERARRAGALVLLGAVAGCAAAGAGKACTEIGVPTGVSLDVAPEDASGVHAAEMEVCWDGECREPGVSLEDSRESADQGCDDGACSAKAVPTGGKHAFASLDGLPEAPVEVHVRLLGEDGEELFDDTAAVTPETVQANGPGCGEGGPQAGVRIEDGALRER